MTLLEAVTLLESCDIVGGCDDSATHVLKPTAFEPLNVRTSTP